MASRSHPTNMHETCRDPRHETRDDSSARLPGRLPGRCFTSGRDGRDGSALLTVFFSGLTKLSTGGTRLTAGGTRDSPHETTRRRTNDTVVTDGLGVYAPCVVSGWVKFSVSSPQKPLRPVAPRCQTSPSDLQVSARDASPGSARRPDRSLRGPWSKRKTLTFSSR